MGEYAAVYARYSSHNQGEQSIDGQLDAARAYATAHGYTIVKEYIDRAQSGRTDNREAFQQMLRDTGRGGFSVLICWKVDRFGRNREEIAVNKMRCKRGGVRVEYVAETIPQTAEGVILESVLEGFAEYYSLQLAQNVKRGMQVTAEKGNACGGRTPMGYRVDPYTRRYVEDPERAPIVRRIYREYARGATISEIIKQLNAEGKRTSRGTPYTVHSIRSVLKNRRYTGVYIHGGTEVPGAVPALIDKATFDKVQKMLEANHRAPAHKWSRSDYILTGKAFCAACGAAMIGSSGTGKSGAKYSYYACINRKNRHGACRAAAVRQDDLEAVVVGEALRIVRDPELLAWIASRAYDVYAADNSNAEELQAVQADQARVDKAINGIMQAIEAGIFTPSVKTRLEALETQKKELAARVDALQAHKGLQLTKEHILYWLQQLAAGDLTDRETVRRIVETFVSRITVQDGRVQITFNYCEGSGQQASQDTKIAGDAFAYPRNGGPQRAAREHFVATFRPWGFIVERVLPTKKAGH